MLEPRWEREIHQGILCSQFFTSTLKAGPWPGPRLTGKWWRYLGRVTGWTSRSGRCPALLLRPHPTRAPRVLSTDSCKFSQVCCFQNLCMTTEDLRPVFWLCRAQCLGKLKKFKECLDELSEGSRGVKALFSSDDPCVWFLKSSIETLKLGKK